MTEGIDFVIEGNVVGEDGKPVKLRNLIKRLWGWPKSAAQMASDYMRANGLLKVWVQEGMRDNQQSELFAALPELASVLCTGLAHQKTLTFNTTREQVQDDD